MSVRHERQPLCIAVLAVGGQGGGVLSNWLLALGEANAWRVQTTSVPGVAQRTGATVYYLEMVPAEDLEPVFALMPSPAGVDLVVAAELMEAGRAIQRGLVSPERTVMIASDHRSYAVLEKAQPGNGAADPQVVLEAASQACKQFLHADMAAIAERHRSAISASLFGAIAAAGVLPFEREAYEQTIRDGGVGVDASLAAFAGGYSAIADRAPASEAVLVSTPGSLQGGRDAQRQRYHALREQASGQFSGEVLTTVIQALDTVVDFQDAEYGEQYMAHLEALTELDGSNEFQLAAARYLAQAFVYDDIVRVADLKTRATRFARVRHEVRAEADNLVHTTEFLHPRVEELCAALPAALGRFVERSKLVSALAGRLLGRGRRIRTDSLSGFLMLHCLAGLRRWRKSMLRHQREFAHIDGWLATVKKALDVDVALAVQVLRCRRLVKGYSDTHARGQSKFDRLMAVVPTLVSHPHGARQLELLLEIAVKDETGADLDVALTELARKSAQPA
jgi:indolepyruvate ferredoxin oxidoreductase, beta subunit